MFILKSRTAFAILSLDNKSTLNGKKTLQEVLNTELNDLRNIICLRNYEVSVERISVCNVFENLPEHGIHCLLIIMLF